MPVPSRGTTLALFQVVEDDTHDNYVECRGYEADEDPYFRYLHDPYTVPTTTPINVAKPYSVRGTNPYVLGQVIVAAKIKGRLGLNPGKAETTVGQPADLDEEVELLLDDDSKSISWLAIETLSSSGIPFLNSSGETVPAYGVMRVTGATAGVIDIDKPNNVWQQSYLVNGSSDVPDGEPGTGTWLNDADYVLYDDAHAPAYGETWGPEDGTWSLKESNPGFTITGGATGSGATARVMAMQKQRGRYFLTTALNHSGGIVAWSASPLQVGNFAEVSASPFTTIDILTGPLQDYHVLINLRVRAVRAGVHTTLITTNIQLEGVDQQSQDSYVYGEDNADAVHTLSEIMTLDVGNSIGVSVTAPSSSSILITGTCLIRPIN